MCGSVRKFLLGSAAILGLSAFTGCSTSMQNHPAMNPDNWVMKHGWTPGFEQRVNHIVRPSQERIDSVMRDPLPDEANGVRNWDTSVYHYPNGAVVAYPTYALNYEDRPAWLSNDYLYSALSPAMLVADAVLLPFGMLIEPPSTEVTYRGPRYAPSMTVAPPLIP